VAQRFLHPAPQDYGIVELREEGGHSRFVLYHEGAELCVCASPEQAVRLAEEHRLRPREAPARVPTGAEEPPLPAGSP
jgi:hypothetical protein